MKLPVDLTEDLEIVAMEALRGRTLTPSLAASLQRDLIGVLRRYGHSDARVQVAVEGSGLSVLLLFPRPGRRVETVTLQLASR